MVKRRDDLPIGMKPRPGDPAVEWLVGAGVTAYQRAVAVMEARADAIAAGEAAELVWLIEHPPLYTAGTSARPEQLIEARFPVYRTGRGGQFTYHGPGQRVAYVMLDLKRRAVDLRRFIATLEEWIIRTLAAFDLHGERREDRIGIWVARPDRNPIGEDKIAAIGIRIRRFVTLHGIALNVDPELADFRGIVPCGISDPRFGVTSLADLGVTAALRQVDGILRETFEPLFGATTLTSEAQALGCGPAHLASGSDA